MKILYLDCQNGASGDMILGSLLDAGLALSDLKKELGRMRISGYALKQNKVRRCGIQAAKFCVELKASRHFQQAGILSLIRKSPLKKSVKDNSTKIFENLFKAEKRIHGAKAAHLHELGDLDSIIDIVGACIGFDELGVEKIYASSLPLSHGRVITAHGRYPLPAPATLELMKGFWARPHKANMEILTPTAAAIIGTLAEHSENMPDIKIDSIGYGAGTHDPQEHPNVLRAVLGKTRESYQSDAVYVVQTNIDDSSGLIFETLYEALFEKGAKDVTACPVYMKKSRPAIMLTVIVDKEKLDDIISVIFDQTTSFGLRYYQAYRKKLARRFVVIKTKYGPVKLKIGEVEGVPKIFSPEYEDCKKLAKAHNIPIMKVYEEAKKHNLNEER